MSDGRVSDDRADESAGLGLPVVLLSTGAAFFAGMVVAALIGRSTANTPQHEASPEKTATRPAARKPAAEYTDLDAACERIAELQDHLDGEGGDWGPLSNIRKRFGPGSWFLPFATKLYEDELWDPEDFWEITANPAACDARFSLELHGEGNIWMYVIPNLASDYGDPPWVTIIFKPSGIASRSAAVANRDRGILGVGRAMGLSAEELDRLKTTLALLPLAYGNDAAVDDAMARFVRALPKRVLARFERCLSYCAVPDPTESFTLARVRQEMRNRSQGIMLDNDVPAIGVILSERTVLEVAFTATEPGGSQGAWEYQEPGPWWSIMIHDADWTDFTSSEEPEVKADGNTYLPWPRVTIEEIDRL